MPPATGTEAKCQPQPQLSGAIVIGAVSEKYCVYVRREHTLTAELGLRTASGIRRRDSGVVFEVA